jgi:hypothetical protein
MQILGFGCDDGYHGEWIEGSLALAAEQTPPMGGGETKVIAIPVNNPEIKAIAGALFQAVGREVPGSHLHERMRRDQFSVEPSSTTGHDRPPALRGGHARVVDLSRHATN